MCISQHATKITPDISKFPRSLKNSVISVQFASYHPSGAYKSQVALIFLENLCIPRCENQSFMFGEGHRLQLLRIEMSRKIFENGTGVSKQGRRKLHNGAFDISYHYHTGLLLIRYDTIYDNVYDTIYLTTIGLTPGGIYIDTFTHKQYTEQNSRHKQCIEQHNSLIRKSVDRVPSLRGIPWHLPYY
jgi:hypothetical protein